MIWCSSRVLIRSSRALFVSRTGGELVVGLVLVMLLSSVVRFWICRVFIVRAVSISDGSLEWISLESIMVEKFVRVPIIRSGLFCSIFRSSFRF